MSKRAQELIDEARKLRAQQPSLTPVKAVMYAAGVRTLNQLPAPGDAMHLDMAVDAVRANPRILDGAS